VREILFRGKVVEDCNYKGKFIHGDFAYGNCIRPIENVGDDIIKSYALYDELAFVKVELETVGQFTGLLDKKGNKVFEGDIVSFYEVLGQQGFMKPFKGVVKYGKGYYYVEYINERNRKGTWNLSSCWHLEVVGNIHDNGELYREIKGE
jgi:uncharacterized phage protein (TIGR01671 family)